MAEKLSETIVKALAAPAKGSKIFYDSEVKGFGARLTAAGHKSFILNYRTRKGRERRITIGSWPDWKTDAARQEAKELKRRVDSGADPMAEVDADRASKTVADMCDRFRDEYLPDTVEGAKLGKAETKLRPATQRDYAALIRREIRPAFKHHAVADLTFSDIDALHRKISKRGATYLANRTVALMSRMLNLSIKWGWRADNPAKGIDRNQEQKRHRYLSPAELVKLTKALLEIDDQQAANIVRLLLLTGARRGEVMAMRWEQLDLSEGVWTKPGSTTKQKTLHRVPLSAPARQLLSDLREKASDDAEYVFPGRGSPHRIEIKGPWHDLCRAAGLVMPVTLTDVKGRERVVLEPSARVHDLRHTYASVLVSAGLSLPIIGALLGHSQPATTHRYAHLMDDPLRQATERAGAIVTAKGGGAQIVQLDGEARHG
ncbi:site-specific integrase [Mesorhizobium sp. Mes31]|uniref:tyrosine-type recombinase/integrase n=1 Tax=Mesorhizobium sp. Mes31 TaxID=2926017 RepID=UPI002119604F|nr:site-specific integrase [Mesorhizobium sp. Mes31]